MKNKTFKSNILIAAVVMSYAGFASPVFADQETTIDDMVRSNKLQQEQLDDQSKTIALMKTQLEALQASKAEGGMGFLKAGNSRTSVELYGHINRGVMALDDGDSTKLYQVDGDASGSRFGLRSSSQITENLTLGTVFEAGFNMNSSSAVSQEDPRGLNSGIYTRHADMFLDHSTYGKVFMGHGSTASDGTSEVDLSGTDLIGYSYASDFGDSIGYVEKGTDSISDNTVGGGIDNMDGLGRDVRVRYDSPSFAGVMASGSYVADGGGDIALKYSGAFSGVKVQGAVAYANPGSTSDVVDNQYNGSVSALHTSGLNATLAGGKQDYKEDNVDNGYFYYGKVGYRNKFFSTGETAVSMDYGRYEDIQSDNIYTGNSDVFGAQLVHNFDAVGVEIYAGYRHYRLDTDAYDYENVNTVITGARISF
ncbi:hypothetical protein DSLASN_23050 [Desulfoluna limicola]|uniref:Porin domain-containing protein n=1 Tax=Desulfoluna limicola TaxID=2810562 RepID=A0ABM7PHV5_9BACT|nr:hypothetical protein [Desulfoluna limicola]BCS96673.1 hypothetical protein DSLASN_23050 [Desulfoluna limicola]